MKKLVIFIAVFLMVCSIALAADKVDEKRPLMTIGDWLIIVAVLAGPILAVQVQKSIESWRERKNRKKYVFKSLMATRGTALSPRHVEALNMIDLEFSVKKPKEKKVVDGWKIYRDHLNSLKIHSDPEYKARLERWTDKSNELLADLLFEMAKAVGYDFDKVHLKKGSYTPQGHADFEFEQNFIRRSLVQLFLNEAKIPVQIVAPPDATGISSEERLRQLLIKHYEGGKPIRVIIEENEEPENKI